MPDLPKPFIFDVPAMLAWSNASGNEAKTVLAHVQQGVVLIFNRVWNEFVSAFPDEAKILATNEFDKQRFNDLHRMSAAALADGNNATFGRKGPYDQCIEWCVAGVACCGPYTVVTDERRKTRYEQIDGVAVVTYEEYLNQH
jgi:hypothetical protein